MSYDGREAPGQNAGAAGYHRNHYVPIWYQRRFLLPGMTELKFHYLDLKPGYVVKGTRKVLRKNLMHWGPARCFYEDDLYTTRFGRFESTKRVAGWTRSGG
jgi:hypothetical protein